MDIVWKHKKYGKIGKWCNFPTKFQNSTIIPKFHKAEEQGLNQIFQCKKKFLKILYISRDIAILRDFNKSAKSWLWTIQFPKSKFDIKLDAQLIFLVQTVFKLNHKRLQSKLSKFPYFYYKSSIKLTAPTSYDVIILSFLPSRL